MKSPERQTECFVSAITVQPLRSSAAREEYAERPCNSVQSSRLRFTCRKETYAIEKTMRLASEGSTTEHPPPCACRSAPCHLRSAARRLARYHCDSASGQSCLNIYALCQALLSFSIRHLSSLLDSPAAPNPLHLPTHSLQSSAVHTYAKRPCSFSDFLTIPISHS